MDSKSPSVERILESLAPALAAEIDRRVQEARQLQEEEFLVRLQSAVREAEQAGGRSIAELKAQFEQQSRAAEASWAAQRARLEDELARWRTYAEAQRELGESTSQADLLRRFLALTEPFAASIALYVMKPDGLALWKSRGRPPFPELVSQSTIDPESYFRPVVVREKTVAAVCAHKPYQAEPLHYLVASLARAIEGFGMKLQGFGLRPGSVPEKAVAGT